MAFLWRRYWVKIRKMLVATFRSLMQHKLRASLSILGIICGVLAVLALLAIGEGAKRESLNQIEELGTRNIYIKAGSLTEEQRAQARRKLSQGLTSSDLERLTYGCPAVEDIAYLKEVTVAIVSTRKDVLPQIAACSPNYADIQQLHVTHGRFIIGDDFDQGNLVCVLGDGIAQSLGVNSDIGSYVRLRNHLFRVVGILKRHDRKSSKSSAITVRNYNEMIFIPGGTERLFGGGGSSGKSFHVAGLTELILQMRSSDQVLRSLDVVKRIMEVAHGGVEDYQIIAPQELLRQAQKIQRTFNIVLGSIAFISLLVGGIGIMNIMIATVSERTKEIGIRRALGASQEDIVVHFLTESIVLTGIGGIIGVILGVGGVWIISSLAEWHTAITGFSLFLPLVMALLVGLFFGIYPAWTAAKMDPIAALRHE
jgi:putative ABC transport system permease protein